MNGNWGEGGDYFSEPGEQMPSHTANRNNGDRSMTDSELCAQVRDRVGVFTAAAAACSAASSSRSKGARKHLQA